MLVDSAAGNNERKARGWESKSIEDQISAAEAPKEAQAKEALTEFEIHRRKRTESLLLERARLQHQMKKANNRRHLELLERALRHIDTELAKIDRADE